MRMNLERMERLAEDLEKMDPTRFHTPTYFGGCDVLEGTGRGKTAAELVAEGATMDVAALVYLTYRPNDQPYGQDIAGIAAKELGMAHKDIFPIIFNNPGKSPREKAGDVRQLIAIHLLESETAVGDAGVEINV